MISSPGIKEIFHSGKEREILLNNSLCAFEDLWKIKSAFLEEPN